MKPFIILPVFIATLLSSKACDLCGCYTPSSSHVVPEDNTIHLSIAEQFTYFGSLRLDGHQVADPADQYLNSSNTQIILGKSFLEDRLNLQANIPFIFRDFRRAEGFNIDKGTESGIGDISLLARYAIYRSESKTESCLCSDEASAMSSFSNKTSISVNAFAGIKLPTGDSGRLKEEFNEIVVPGAPESGIHGHDLALGSGSYDVLVGGDVFVRLNRWFFEGDLQYAIRTEGDHSYRYANDLTWSCGPGWYALRDKQRTFAIQFVASGESKNKDRFDGASAEDTGITSVYLGPHVLGSFHSWSGELGFDLPVVLDNTSLQAVPDYRIRAAITWRF